MLHSPAPSFPTTFASLTRRPPPCLDQNRKPHLGHVSRPDVLPCLTGIICHATPDATSNRSSVQLYSTEELAYPFQEAPFEPLPFRPPLKSSPKMTGFHHQFGKAAIRRRHPNKDPGYTHTKDGLHRPSIRVQPVQHVMPNSIRIFPQLLRPVVVELLI